MRSFSHSIPELTDRRGWRGWQHDRNGTSETGGTDPGRLPVESCQVQENDWWVGRGERGEGVRKLLRCVWQCCKGSLLQRRFFFCSYVAFIVFVYLVQQIEHHPSLWFQTKRHWFIYQSSISDISLVFLKRNEAPLTSRLALKLQRNWSHKQNSLRTSETMFKTCSLISGVQRKNWGKVHPVSFIFQWWCYPHIHVRYDAVLVWAKKNNLVVDIYSELFHGLSFPTYGDPFHHPLIDLPRVSYCFFVWRSFRLFGSMTPSQSVCPPNGHWSNYYVLPSSRHHWCDFHCGVQANQPWCWRQQSAWIPERCLDVAFFFVLFNPRSSKSGMMFLHIRYTKLQCQ